MGRTKQVNVILVGPHGFHAQGITLFNLMSDVYQMRLDFRAHQGFSVLDREDEVIMQFISAMPAFVRCHKPKYSPNQSRLFRDWGYVRLRGLLPPLPRLAPCGKTAGFPGAMNYQMPTHCYENAPQRLLGFLPTGAYGYCTVSLSARREKRIQG